MSLMQLMELKLCRNFNELKNFFLNSFALAIIGHVIFTHIIVILTSSIVGLLSQFRFCFDANLK